MDIAALRAAYPVTERCTYLNHAAVGPVSRTVAAATAEPAQLQLDDPVAMNAALAERSESARVRAAALFGADPARVAFVGNTSHGLSLIANGLSWRPGANIVVAPDEFPSNHLIWQQQRARGAALRDFVAEDGRLTPDALARVIDADTQVVALSHVQFHNGFRADLAALGEIARHHGAMLVVDGTQSAGAMAFDLDGWGVDALVFSAHKWMLCPKGIGMMLLSPRALDEIAVTAPGWQSVNDRFAFRRTLDFLPSAARFEPGTENAPGRFAIDARLGEIATLGPAQIAARVIGLRDRLAAAVRGSGWQVTSPDAPSARSGILTIRHDRVETGQALARLDAAGIRASARGGALRLSPHVYNTEQDCDRFVDVLLSILK